MVVNFRGDQIFVDTVRFLIHEVLYARCLRYNICSAWFLDIRISTCFWLICIAALMYVLLCKLKNGAAMAAS